MSAGTILAMWFNFCAFAVIAVLLVFLPPALALIGALVNIFVCTVTVTLLLDRQRGAT